MKKLTMLLFLISLITSAQEINSENCRGFFIIKPNENFMKYYGGDYYSEVKKILENK